MLSSILNTPYRKVFLLVGTLLLVGLGSKPACAKTQPCNTQERLIIKPVNYDIESKIMSSVVATGAVQALKKFEFKEKKLPPELGEPIHHIRDMKVEGGFLKFRSTGNDPYFTLRGLQIQAKGAIVIAVRAVYKNTMGRREDLMKIHFSTDHHSKFESQRSLSAHVQMDGELRTVLFFTSRTPAWKGTITGLRVDPAETTDREVAIQEIAILKARGDMDFTALNLPPTMFARTSIHGELQNVVFAQFDAPVEWTLTLPCEPEFNAQLALPGIYRFLDWRSFQALLEVRDRTGEWTTISRLPIDKSTKRRFLHHGANMKVALGRWSGQQVTIRMRVLETEAGSARGGFIYWINPYVSSQKSTPARPNIILISIDTLRADHLSLYGYPRRTSPNLDAWAKKGIVFDNAISHSPWTLPSHASLFTSLYPSQHQAISHSAQGWAAREGDSNKGLEEHGRLPGGFETLAERLQKDGYITAGFVGGLFVSSEVGLDQGFDSWFQTFKFRSGLSRVSEWLDQHSSARFFLFLHTYEVHDYHLTHELKTARHRAGTFYHGYRGKVLENDFTFSKHIAGQYNRTMLVEDGYEVIGIGLHTRDYLSEGLSFDDIVFLEAMYDGQILSVDRELDRFFDDLARLGLEDNTVIIITSDHGEEFNEHGGLMHGSSLYDEMIRVPLIIRYPKGFPQRQVVTHQVRLIDLYPTILELAGLPVPEGLEGQSLLPLINGRGDDQERTAYHEEPARLLSGVRTNSEKYIYQGGNQVAFDLIKDPLEQYPEAPQQKVSKLKGIHDQFIEKNGGYHLLARGSRLDGCPIRLTTDGRFLNVIPRLTESLDVLRVNNKQIDLTFSLKDWDVDGLYFLVSSALASVKVQMCQSEVGNGGGVEVNLGANGPVRMGSEWTVGQEVSLGTVRVSSPPIHQPTDLQADAALWYLETRPVTDEETTDLTLEQKEEFLRRLRNLGYLE
jgi:hypothetical protein